jgi:hypothetical protein
MSKKLSRRDFSKDRNSGAVGVAVFLNFWPRAHKTKKR